jgi:hypothetical protein
MKQLPAITTEALYFRTKTNRQANSATEQINTGS